MTQTVKRARRMRGVLQRRQGITFNVGPWVYKVQIVKDLRHWNDDRPIWGMADEATRTISISADVSPANRLDVVLHELTHCWMFHFPRPRTDEETCDFTASIIAGAFRDLIRQGGEQALAQLQIEPGGPVGVK